VSVEGMIASFDLNFLTFFFLGTANMSEDRTALSTGAILVMSM
jgi:hypothetical protein